MSAVGSEGRVQPARPGDPARIGPYRIIGRLGAGGMGTVHAGLAPDGLRVAVKVIHPAHSGDPEFLARFRREVRLSTRVQGPCLIPLLAADPEADAPWLATEYAPGPTLGAHLAAHGPLTGGTLYAFATGTAQALAAVHAAGVVHRDVKPQNIILTPAGPRVLDFGIAHAADGTSVTRTGVMTGTPGWISPEHYRTGAAGTEGDVFAWGALVAHAATGRLPFGSGAPDVVAFRVLSGEPDLDGVPGELRTILERALAKDPADRPAAEAAARACAPLLAAQATQILPEGDPAPEPARIAELLADQWELPARDDPDWPAPSRARRRRVLAAVLVTAAVAGGAAASFHAFPDERKDSSGGADRSITAGPATSPAAPARRTASGAPDGGADTGADGTADGKADAKADGGAAGKPADPRTAAVPTDPLAGVARPAFTRADDLSQPTLDTWTASVAPATREEKDAAKAIRKHMTAMLATKDMAYMEPTVTFNERAQTVLVTGGPVNTLPDETRAVFGRAGRTAACVALARRLEAAPADWPYGRYHVHWKESADQTEAPFLGYGQAASGCYGEVAGEWRGSEEGLATAGHPSADRDEVRVAEATVEALRAAWDARVAEGHGLSPLDGPGSLDLGFDPVEDAVYLWVQDDSGGLGGRAQQSHLREVAETTVCRKLLAEQDGDRDWNYQRWSVVLYGGNNGLPDFIGSGSCALSADRS
ncbi:serine/threonine-protein kinase [Streptomyces sp. NPDC020141]|uniref:serine/threonine-protein kinase n=1 Tax=Streptomyces sp. NPDC020141 TaxID=3365065 RepID=UPI0037A03388